jgi:capsular polysaccharide biosynthesis protein
MSEQVIDVRSVASLVRRKPRPVLVAMSLGAVVGAGVVFLDHTPAYHSSSQVLLAPAPPSDGVTPGRDSATQVRIASSEVVLRPAGAAVTPHLSLDQVAKLVKVSAPTDDVIKIDAQGATAARAEALARAVAESEVAYQAMAASSLTNAEQIAAKKRGDALKASLASVNAEIAATNDRLEQGSKNSQQGRADLTALAQLTAQQGDLTLQIDSLSQQVSSAKVGGDASVIEQASPAKRTEPILWYLLAVIIGAALALAVTLMVLVGRAQRDRRLRTRDEIADSLGSAVIGSVHAQPQRNAAGWTALLEAYDPLVTDRWALRQILHHVGLGELTVRGGTNGHGAPSRTVTVVTLSDDPRALALGPQLASHAASLGIKTRLITGQGHDAAASLWSATAALRREPDVRPGLSVDNRRPRGRPAADLTVRVVVVDQSRPELVNRAGGGVTLLAISSGAATPEDLARAAVAAYESGGPISGVIVMDPDPLDHTTGRLLLQQRSEQGPLPARITGVVAPPSTPADHPWERGGEQ